MIDIYERLSEFRDNNEADAKKRLSATGDQIGELGRWEDMITAEFPELETDRRRDVAKAFVTELIETLKQSGRRFGSITVNAIIDSPGATINPPAVPAPKQETPEITDANRIKFALNFLKFESPKDKANASFNERIVLSFLFQYSTYNLTNKVKRKATVERIRKDSGIHRVQIKKYLKTLQDDGYINSDLEPLVTREKGSKVKFTFQNGATWKGYVHASWESNKSSRIKSGIFTAWALSSNVVTIPFVSKALGVNERTAETYIADYRKGA